MSALASDHVRSRTIMLGVAILALFAGTLAMWAYYGTTVFFETIRAGWAACF